LIVCASSFAKTGGGRLVPNIAGLIQPTPQRGDGFSPGDLAVLELIEDRVDPLSTVKPEHQLGELEHIGERA
jgi:hypothetical protein